GHCPDSRCLPGPRPGTRLPRRGPGRDGVAALRRACADRDRCRGRPDRRLPRRPARPGEVQRQPHAAEARPGRGGGGGPQPGRWPRQAARPHRAGPRQPRPHRCLCRAAGRRRAAPPARHPAAGGGGWPRRLCRGARREPHRPPAGGAGRHRARLPSRRPRRLRRAARPDLCPPRRLRPRVRGAGRRGARRVQRPARPSGQPALPGPPGRGHPRHHRHRWRGSRPRHRPSALVRGGGGAARHRARPPPARHGARLLRPRGLRGNPTLDLPRPRRRSPPLRGRRLHPGRGTSRPAMGRRGHGAALPAPARAL
ncbi:MAG: Transcriptional regulator, MarR family / Acetyltransferase (GNAT), partial [uncultured Craurococcus sp.]